MARTVAIIGAGFSGTLTAVHLLHAPVDAGGPEKIVLIESTGRFGPGLAYGTRRVEHVLNVPAGRMSAFPDRPGNFVEWLEKNEPSSAGAFVPRSYYGRYLAALLDEAEQRAPGRLRRVTARASDLEIRTDRVVLALEREGGERSVMEADHAVLAIGNGAPADPPLADASIFASPRYFRDPWSFLKHPPEHLLRHPAQDVLILGSGLTMYDAALTLSVLASTGVIHAVSRRGLRPAPHRREAPNFHPTPPPDINAWPNTTRGLLRRVREQVEDAQSRGVDWREVITSLRSVTARLWSGLPDRERARFLSRVRPYWDAGRHRAAPVPAAVIDSLIAQQQLVVHAARVISISDTGEALEAVLRPRGQNGTTTLRVGAVLNCTGPDMDATRADPPIDAMTRRGLICPDVCRLGLRCDDRGRILDAQGQANERLWHVGPWRRADLWEATAVPELRLHAAAVAQSILAS